MNREEQLEQQLKKNRKEITKDFMDFIAQFEVKDGDYFFCELEYLNRVLEVFKDNLKSAKKDLGKIYGDMENKNE